MFDPHRNRDGHRPFGEGTPVPDHELDGDSDAETGFFTDGTYPDPTDRSEFSCRNCRQAIPADRSRCGYCGTAHARHRNAATATAGSGLRQDRRDTHSVSRTLTGADRWVWRRVIFAVVAARSRLAAIAKASVACSFLVKREDPVTKCRLVDDFVEGPPEAVAAPWGHLPTMAQTDSPIGQHLLRHAIGQSVSADESLPGEQSGTPVTTDAITTHLYDESGAGIRSRSELASREAEATAPVWLIPAIAYGPTTEQAPHNSEAPGSRSTHDGLRCHDCDRSTVQDFVGYDDGPYTAAPGQPIWQCRTCDAHRYGPMPDTPGRPIAGRSRDDRTTT